MDPKLSKYWGGHMRQESGLRAEWIRNWKWISAALVLAAVTMAVPTWAAADSASPAVSASGSWINHISLYGDFRARAENFWFEGTKPDLHRLRYRLRTGLRARVNDYVKIETRFATGSDATSGNQTIGGGQTRVTGTPLATDPKSGVDFDPDNVFIDRAFVTVSPFGKEPPVGDALNIKFGKMSNPFKPKGMGKAYLIWDADVMPEGIAMNFSIKPVDVWIANLDFAYFVIDENSSANDPGIFALQLDNKIKAAEKVIIRAQFSYYALHQLDAAFFARAGNAALTTDSRIDLLESQAAMTLRYIKDWPITAYGNVIFNVDAQPSPGLNKQGPGLGRGSRDRRQEEVGEAGCDLPASGRERCTHQHD